MGRLIVALLFVVALVVALAVLMLAVRTFTGTIADTESTRPMQKTAFALLLALIVYVAVVGVA